MLVVWARLHVSECFIKLLSLVLVQLNIIVQECIFKDIILYLFN